MLGLWKRLPLAAQFVVLLLFTGLVAIACAYQIGAAIYQAEVRNQARTVADMVDNFGKWASQYKGIWVKGDVQDPSMQVGDYLERELYAKAGKNIANFSESELSLMADVASFHRKNPALIQRELSEITQASETKTKFRITSDRFMNPNNAPNHFELSAMESMKAQGINEVSEVRNGMFLYARQLVATKACLKCHDSPATAPKAVRTLYPETRGYGYKEGQLAGVISVSVPMNYTPDSFVREFDAKSWLAILGLLLAICGVLLFVRRAIIAPVRRLQRFAAQAANADLGTSLRELSFDENEHKSKNEIHRLNAAIKAMHSSIEFLYQRKRSESKSKSPNN
ncbi:Tll0287-like domain-containing protein [Parachitinimonas caeni]|uniref:DUF3365 domain-containing protein n=1 Tax=Parachitinimonas caeni TaxID=3031301 RepID=A0ABT7DYW1_9NEIS|nr:DUF3365 domain-containing protein [Parachitinimonas caeni]MDK2125231.1 DUF3365 domain-containing protein [Parachitinimonas caeni]